MWTYNHNTTHSNDELQHYGVLGMKWGVRRTRSQLDRARRAESEAKTAKKLATAYTNAMDKRAVKKPSSVTRANEAKKAHKLADTYVNAMNKKATKARTKATTLDKRREAKLSRKRDIAKTYQDINRQTSIGDKLIYNKTTRKRAAKYVVDRNMTVSEATKKAKGDVWRNSAIFVAAYGAVAYSTLKRMN